MNEKIIMTFDDLSIGARFKYANSALKNPQVWIKINNEGRGLVAEYNKDYISHEKWIGQCICSAKEDEKEILLVEFVE